MSQRWWFAQRGVGILLAALVCAGGVAAEEPIPARLEGSHPTGSDVLVSQSEWARDLVEHLGLDSALPDDPDDNDLFGLLCVEQVEMALGSGGRRVAPGGAFRIGIEPPPRRTPTEPVRVVVSVPATGLYQLSIEGVGPQRWVVDQRPVGHLDPSSLGVALAPAVLALREGPHEIAGYMGSSARVERIELVAHRTLCIAPAEGWDATRPLTYGGRARTLVRAFDLEHRLGEHEEAQIRIEGEAFDEVTAGGGRTNRRLAQPARNRAWAAAVQSPAEFTWRVSLRAPSVVTILARTHGVPEQIWSVDGRYRIALRPRHDPAGFVWNRVSTLALSSGHHAIRALLPRGSGIDSLRIVQHRSKDADYQDVLRELAIPSGAPGAPVPRSAAHDLLGSAAFGEFAAGFRLRLAGDTRDRSIVLIDDAPARLTTRALSPLLPADL